MVEICGALHRNGWVANHDGNATYRLDANRYLSTPTAESKGVVRDDMLIVIDGNGKVLSGTYRPFSERVLHLAAYDARPDVQAVLHAHPPSATAFAVAGQGLDRPIIAEAIVSIGPRVPLVPYSMPGSTAFVANVREHLVNYDALLLENHGVLTVGSTLEQAFLRMELVEHLATIELKARQLGSVQYIPDGDVQQLLDKRKGAGLGPESRGLVDPHRTDSAAGAADSDVLRQIVAEEIKAMLKG